MSETIYIRLPKPSDCREAIDSYYEFLNSKAYKRYMNSYGRLREPSKLCNRRDKLITLDIDVLHLFQGIVKFGVRLPYFKSWGLSQEKSHYYNNVFLKSDVHIRDYNILYYDQLISNRVFSFIFSDDLFKDYEKFYGEYAKMSNSWERSDGYLIPMPPQELARLEAMRKERSVTKEDYDAMRETRFELSDEFCELWCSILTEYEFEKPVKEITERIADKKGLSSSNILNGSN